MPSTQRINLHAILSRLIILGVIVVFTVPGLALAAKPADPHEQSVPVQLTLIRDYLADMDGRLNDRLDLMESNLSGQMTGMETNLTGQMSGIKSDLDTQLDAILGQTEANYDEILYIKSVVDSTWEELTAVKLEMKTELCLDESVMAGLNGGAHGEFGVGWPNVLDAKVALQGDAGFGVEVGLGNEICIEIPLYSVVADTWLLDYSNFQSPEFDSMLATVAGGAQVVVPFWASVYDELMPTPEEALEALENYVIAATGKDLDGASSSKFEPTDLLYPELLLEPMIPDIYYTFINEIPDQVKAFAEEPCDALSAGPLGVILSPDDPLVDFMCDATSDVLMTAVTVTEGVVSAIANVINGIRDFLKLAFPLIPWP